MNPSNAVQVVRLCLVVVPLAQNHAHHLLNSHEGLSWLARQDHPWLVLICLCKPAPFFALAIPVLHSFVTLTTFFHPILILELLPLSPYL